jgi:hypothetical protein
MDQQTRRRLIQGKLLDGTLPYDSIPRVWGGAGYGEMCNGLRIPAILIAQSGRS